ncbi:MAG: lysophospholipid acyltransferase family protein [Acidobacteriota bacterium]|nr:lysophospholipid acyltransferase family protein [Acidobacteriota bacterium]
MIISGISTFGFLFIGVAVMIIGTPVMAIIHIIDRSGKIAHYMIKWYFTMLSLILGIRISIEGKEHLNRKKSYLIISNHKSSVDIIILARILPTHFKFLASSFLFSFPFFGWCMSMAGYLPINRSNTEEAYKSLDKSIDVLKQGKASILIFPEGTRSAKPDIGRFKKGFLHIATNAQKPILPIVLDGTAEIKRKDNFWYHSGRVKITILPPLSTKGFKQGDWEELREKIECRVRKEYNRIHKARIAHLDGKNQA